jgi:nucleoside triphosphatase
MQKEEKKYPEPIIGALIVNKEGKILLAKNKKWSKGYMIPGGHVEFGETLEKAVSREVKEETGLDIVPTSKIYFTDGVFPPEYHEKKHFIYNYFICEYKGDPQKVKLNDEFEKEYVWASIEDALKLEMVDALRELLQAYILFQSSQNALESWKRCQADFENYKKNQAQHQEEFRKYAKIDVIEQILPVVDNFEASLAHVPEKSQENKWVEGIVYIKKQLEDVLKNNDIEEIVVKAGDKFNPEIHEAVGGDGKKQIVSKVLLKGYRLNGRILRAAKVEVG